MTEADAPARKVLRLAVTTLAHEVDPGAPNRSHGDPVAAMARVTKDRQAGVDATQVLHQSVSRTVENIQAQAPSGAA